MHTVLHYKKCVSEKSAIKKSTILNYISLDLYVAKITLI